MRDPGAPNPREAGAGTSLTSLARMGVESGGALTERTNDSVLAFTTAWNRLSCVYSLGFRDDDAQGGRRKTVSVTLRRKGLRAYHPESYVVRTESMKRESRLLAAFLDPSMGDDGTLRALLIPRGGDGAKWKVTVQLRMRPTGISDTSAELGASVVRHDAVTDHFASSIATKRGSRTLVLEKTLDLAPGDFSVVAVAQEVKSGRVGSSRLEARWPDPAGAQAAIAPIAVLQAAPAAISRDGDYAPSGSLARDLDETLSPAADISLRSVVCRGPKTQGPVLIERWVEGGSHDEFAPMTLAATDDACLETVDVLRRGQLSPGDVDYRIVARVGQEIVAQERRSLHVGANP